MVASHAVALLKTGASSLQAWENGSARPKPETMVKIAKMLGITTEELTELWKEWESRMPSLD